MTGEAVAYASVDIREVLRQAGEEAADNNLSFGAAAGILPLLAGVRAVVVALLLNRGNSADE